MVYEIEDENVVLSKEGKYEYIQNDIVYRLTLNYYDDADDINDIKEIMNDITDNYDIYSDFDKGYLTKSKEDHIIFTLHGQFNSGGFFLDFAIDEYIESIFKRLNYTYSSEYIIKYYTQIIKNKKIKSKEFHVDEDGLFFNDEDIFGRVELVNMRVKYIKVEMTKKY